MDMLSKKKRIYVYGKGSSGLAAMEMKFRFMRIGANIEAITDEHIMKMNSVLLDGDCAVIGISVSTGESHFSTVPDSHYGGHVVFSDASTG